MGPYLCIGLRAEHRGMLLGVLLLGGGKWLRIELCGRGLEIPINGKRAYEAIVFYLERLALKIAGKSSQRLRLLDTGPYLFGGGQKEVSSCHGCRSI